MKMKKFGCAVLCTAMLTAVFAPSAGAWSVFDKDYGAEGLEQSSTLVTDDMVTVREKTTRTTQHRLFTPFFPTATQ